MIDQKRCPFQSTRPSRGETKPAGQDWIGDAHFNPLAPRGARHQQIHRQRYTGDFNPLAPRGARHWTLKLPQRLTNFNPLAPRGARQSRGLEYYIKESLFQSTRPSRGETVSESDLRYHVLHFNPLAPRGARRTGNQQARRTHTFQSTRPSRGETWLALFWLRARGFQSTRPSRGETP